VLAFTIFGGISVYANTPKTVIISSISSLNILYFAFKKVLYSWWKQRAYFSHWQYEQ